MLCHCNLLWGVLWDTGFWTWNNPQSNRDTQLCHTLKTPVISIWIKNLFPAPILAGRQYQECDHIFRIFTPIDNPKLFLHFYMTCKLVSLIHPHSQNTTFISQTDTNSIRKKNMFQSIASKYILIRIFLLLKMSFMIKSINRNEGNGYI